MWNAEQPGFSLILIQVLSEGDKQRHDTPILGEKAARRSAEPKPTRVQFMVVESNVGGFDDGRERDRQRLFKLRSRRSGHHISRALAHTRLVGPTFPSIIIQYFQPRRRSK